MTQLSLVERLVRWRYLIMAGLAVLMFVSVMAQLQGTSDWSYFVLGADVLFGSPPPTFDPVPQYTPEGQGGLHLYAEHSFIQIGPPSLLLAQLLQIGPKDGMYVAAALVQFLGLVCVWLVERAALRLGDHVRIVTLLGGSMVTVVWGSLSYYTHLDDAIAITCVAAALLALQNGRWDGVGLLLGLGAASKPWGIVVIALVLAAPTWRSRIRSAVFAGSVVGAFWAPFVIADLDTLTVNTFNLPTSARSPLAAVGLAGTHLGEWIRPVQFLVATTVTLLPAAARQWALIPLLGFATRLLFDPAAYQYYVAGLVVGAFVADIAVVRRRIPLLTTTVTLSFLMVPFLDAAPAVASLRASTYVIVILATLVIIARDRRRTRCAPAALPKT